MQADVGALSVLDGIAMRNKNRCMFRKPAVSAATRWGSRIEGQSSLGVDGRVFAAGLIQVAGDGTVDVLSKGVAAPFQTSGLQVEGTLRMASAKLGSAIRCLTSQTLNFYHAVARLQCTLGVRPMLLAFSKDLECLASSVCGVGSYFRRYLQLVTDKMWVGLFNSADCKPKRPYLNVQASAQARRKQFVGTSKRFDDRTRKVGSDQRPHTTVRLAHRGWRSLAGSHKIMFMINPNTDVKRVLGEANPEMVDSVRALLRDFRRIAEMPGKLELLPTLETRWMERERANAAPDPASHWSAVVVVAGKDKHGGKPGVAAADLSRKAAAIAGAQYVHNMHKAQWAFREIVDDVVMATEKWFDHELYSPFGFLACMIQTRWVPVLKVATGEKMKILIAHEDAIPNGQVGSRILDELSAHFVGQGEAAFLDYYPPQLSDMLNDGEAMKQLPEFLRGGAMGGFHLLGPDGNIFLVDSGKKDVHGNKITQPVVAGPAPLWRFPDLARRVLKLYFCQLSSNDVERVFSLVARGFRGGGRNVGYRCISSWCRRKDWVSGRLFGKESDPDFLKVFGAARRLVRENEAGMLKIFTQDADTSERRKRFKQQVELPGYIKNGTRGFTTTHMEPSSKESLVGPKKESSKDPTVKPASTRAPKPARNRASRIGVLVVAARLAALKSKNHCRPRARASAVPKRKRNAQAPRGRTKRQRCGSFPDTDDPMPTAEPGADPCASDAESAGCSAVESRVGAGASDTTSGNTSGTDKAALAAGTEAHAARAASVTPGRKSALNSHLSESDDSDKSELDVPISSLSQKKGSTLRSDAGAAAGHAADDAGAAGRAAGAAAGAGGAAGRTAGAAGGAAGRAAGAAADDGGAAGRAAGAAGRTAGAAAGAGGAAGRTAGAAAGAGGAAGRTAGAAGGAAGRATGAAAGAGGAAPDAGAAAGFPCDVLAMQLRINALVQDSSQAWTPSVRIEVKSPIGEKSSFGVRCFDNKIHVVRQRSSCTLNLAYDHSGDGNVKLIQIVETQKSTSSLYMEYYVVYPHAKAIVEAAEKGDVTTSIRDANGFVKQIVMKGAASLRAEAMDARVLLHHAGDILHCSTDSGEMNLGNIIGTIAWVTRASLGGKRNLEHNDLCRLQRSLIALGITKDEAGRLAEKPIFLGLVFNERITAGTRDEDGDFEDNDASDDEASTTGQDLNTDGLVLQQATMAQARAQRAAARAAAKRTSAPP